MIKGKVYLVGAGPGDPGLITVKGLECVERADCVIYDRLVSPSLICRARGDAELVCAGKRAGDHTLGQDEINQLLAERAKEGKVVCRLKGGDPFIFGRGGEEAAFLVERGIPFEVVPGVTSAISAPAYAGIPLTFRGVSSSLTIVTGHEDPTKPGSDLDWEALSRCKGTLVILMGIGQLPQIVERLLHHGREKDTPVAIVRWGTTPLQETVAGTLEDIVERAHQRGIKPPAVIVVGAVVRFRDALNWFETKPLFGKTILVTRAREGASELSNMLAEQGALPVLLPTIEAVEVEDRTPLDRAIERLGTYDWIVFTSRNGVRFFFRRLNDRGLDARALHKAKIGAIGVKTAGELRDLGLLADAVPEEYRAEALVPALGDVEGKRILIPRAEVARDVLPEGLIAKGASVDIAPVYRTIKPKGGAEEALKMLREGNLDVITFTSSSTVRNLIDILGGEEGALRCINRSQVACIGPITAETARRSGIRVDSVAQPHTIEGLVRAIEQLVGARERKESEGER
ncbi:MAG: uroporphyrinogen-III C-methyltransferase [bacterium]